MTTEKINLMTENLRKVRKSLVDDVITPFSKKPFKDFIHYTVSYPKNLSDDHIMTERRKNIAKIVANNYIRIFNKEIPNHESIKEEIISQLVNLPVVSTADHQAPLLHPFNLEANIVLMLAMKKVKAKYMFVAAGNTTPLSNYVQPGGIYTSMGNVGILKGKERNIITAVAPGFIHKDYVNWIWEKEKEYLSLAVTAIIQTRLNKIQYKIKNENDKLNFLQNINKLCNSFKSSFTYDNLKSLIEKNDPNPLRKKISINTLLKNFEPIGYLGLINKAIEETFANDFSKSVTQKIKKQLQVVILILNSLNEVCDPTDKYYWEQITKLNQKLLEKIYPNSSMKYLNIPLETIVIQDLIDNHIENNNSLLHKILFDVKICEEFIKAFDGLDCSWKIKDNKNSVLFLGIDPVTKTRIDLIVKKEINIHFLIDKKTGGSIYNIRLEPQAIKHALQKKLIFPVASLALLNLAIYNGFKCLGGYMQVQYLKDYKDRWIKLLNKFGFVDEVSRAKDVPVVNYAAGIALIFTKDVNKSIAVANGVDIIAAGGLTEKHMDKLMRTKGILLFATGYPDMWQAIFFEKSPYSFEKIIKLVDPEEKELIYI